MREEKKNCGCVYLVGGMENSRENCFLPRPTSCEEAVFSPNYGESGLNMGNYPFAPPVVSLFHFQALNVHKFF